MEDYNNCSSSRSSFKRIFELEDMNHNIFLPIAANIHYNSSSNNVSPQHLIMSSFKDSLSSSSSSWPNNPALMIRTPTSTAASTDFDQLQDDHVVVNEPTRISKLDDDDDQLVLLLQQQQLQSSAAGNNNNNSNNNYSNQLQLMKSSSSTDLSDGGGAAAGGDIIINDQKKKGSSSSSSSGGRISAGEKKVKKPRYAFQTRSQVDILDDGYRWRKYGQKAVKNNKFPRSYYRCTHQSCNVKKQVQRLSKDDGVVVTTYEGIHTHAIERPTDNFDSILSQMQIYAKF